VYKLHKALYGLRQAPRAWNEKINNVLGELNFVKCTKEPALYQRQYKDQYLLVAVYVDDLDILDEQFVFFKLLAQNIRKFLKQCSRFLLR